MPRKPRREGGPTPQAAQNATAQPPRAPNPPPIPPPVAPGAGGTPNQPLTSVPTGLPQGEHQALEQSMSAVPVPNMDARIQEAVNAVNSQPPSQPMLGGGNILSQPTAYPNQPPQDGLPMGPGRGPEAVPPPAVPAEAADYNMARYLPALEVLADQPQASNATRNWVRLLRGQMPSNITMASIVQPQPGGQPGGLPR